MCERDWRVPCQFVVIVVHWRWPFPWLVHVYSKSKWHAETKYFGSDLVSEAVKCPQWHSRLMSE